MTDQPDTMSPLKRAIVEIRDLKARLAGAERREREPIAITGVGLRFPGGADDPDSFWKLLWDGVDAIGEVPPERWPIDALYDPDPDTPGHMATRHGGFLPDVDRFDAHFFGISPREAETMDPQQRLLLEVTWEALEHAGIAADRLAGSRTGVFMGITTTDYFRMLLADRDGIDTFTTTGNAPSVGAGRLSYLLGLEGPSIALDTACSSSLVGVHLAAQSLRSGESDLALAGGVGLILAPELTINFSRARMMAPDGRCKTFDAAADGYVRSEGCGVVVLKRLSDAVADGDRVLAVVRGSAVNQDGRSGGLTAPNGPSQERVISAALASAGVAPGDVSYIEAHGTGTPLGDPIEVRALGSVLCGGRDRTDPLLLGSVKTNVGHLEAAAGIAGLIKVVLMLQHGAIPPHLHLRELSPHIAAEDLPVAIPTERTVWPEHPAGRIAGVSSFGLSGTNAHVIVAAAPPADAVAPSTAPADRHVDAPQQVLPLSARDPDGLAAAAQRYATLLESADVSLAEVAAGAATRRAHLDHRLAVVAGDSASAAARLVAFAEGDAAGVVTGPPVVGTPEVAFVYTGHGSHHAGMGRELYAHHPSFRDAIDRCDALLGDSLDRRLPEILFGDDGLLDSMRYAQPALFAFQYALTELWRAWGVQPAVVAGHSAGEYAAAVTAGTLSLPDGLRIVTERGRLMDALPHDGEMVAIFLEEARVAPVVAGHADDVGIAAVNGPTTTVVSGRRAAIAAVIAELGLDDDDFRRLDVSVAAHSPLVEPILDDFEDVVRQTRLAPPVLGLVSSMTGSVVGAELTDPGYWRRHLRQPVRFASVFDTLRAAGFSTFVEIGPHPTLLGLGQRCWPDDSATWAASMRRDGGQWQQLLSAVATLHVRGVPIDWAAVTRASERRRVELPTYPWQRESFWAAVDAPGSAAAAVPVWPAVTEAAELQSDQAPLDLRVDRYAARWSLLDRIATAAIVDTLRSAGLFAASGESHTVKALIDDGHFLATYAHLAERWLGHLVDDGLLVRSGHDGFRADAPLTDPQLAELLATGEHELDGGAEPLLEYVRRCCQSLAAVVRGDESALTTLFPDGSYDTVDFLYHRWAVARYVNGIARAALSAVANARPGHPLRVLEVGAGTGGTTATVVPALPADRTTYTFTDVSEFFLSRAADRFAEYPFMDYTLLDLEGDLAEQGFRSGDYDVVVAANVLHATSDLDATLARVRDLLAPGGVLLAYEATRHPRWFDVTTGLIEGWQRFDDEWRDDNPLIDPDRWRAALGAAGFTDVLTLPGPEQPTAVLGQHLLLARAPGDELSQRRAPGRGATTDHADHAVRGARSTAVVEVPASDELAAALADALPDERLDVLVDFVRRAIARVLRIADPSALRRDQPLLDLGFDSLMAVELRNVLRTGLAIEHKLPATLVFDHPTIVAIAAHLDGLLGGSQPGRVDIAVPDGGAPREHTASVGEEELAAMSDAEVEAMLLEKLTTFGESS